MTRWPDCFSRFGHLQQLKFAQKNTNCPKVGSQLCQIPNKPLKLLQISKFLLKWRNFAKCGHTDRKYPHKYRVIQMFWICEANYQWQISRTTFKASFQYQPVYGHYQGDGTHDWDRQAHAKGPAGGLLSARHVRVIVWHLHLELGRWAACRVNLERSRSNQCWSWMGQRMWQSYLRPVWPDVEIKCSPSFSKRCLKWSHGSFHKSIMFFTLAQKIIINFGYFLKKVCHQDFSKTVHLLATPPAVRGSNPVIGFLNDWLNFCCLSL